MHTTSRELTQQEYETTFSPPMINVTENADELVDLWPYANQVIEEKYHSCTAWEWRVMSIYETQDGAYQHVNIPVPKDDTYLSIVISRFERRILGHMILELRALCPDCVKKHDKPQGGLMVVRLSPGVDATRTPEYRQVLGERAFSSGHPAMQALNPRVYQLIVFIARGGGV